MLVIPLSDASRVDRVGGKAAGLGELIRRGERVPDGFVVTTAAYRDGVTPEKEIRSAYGDMAAGPVAVRSSATAEDLPGASFAGQHDSVLGVNGGDELIAAVARCWESLHSTRATAYRDARGIANDDVRMAVIVQRIVDAETAGVLFTDPEQAPDRRFRRAAEAGEAALTEVAARARRRRPVRGTLAVFLLRRARRLAGLREAGKFAGLYRLRAVREQLLLIGAELAGAGSLEEAADVMFLTLDEVAAAVGHGTDQRETVVARKAVHRAESLRRSVPVALLSDGTDVESLLPVAPAAAGVLIGVGASAGRVTGPARVVLDPATARVEPGEVLVAATTDPGWTPLFLTAAALVTETGAIMAHGPTVAREYGIPAVISVPGATERIATGRLVTVDGAAGTVSM